MQDSNGDNGQTFVRVTNRDIWNKLNEIEKIVSTVPEDHKKIRSLELKVYWILAGLTTSFLAVGYALVGAQ